VNLTLAVYHSFVESIPIKTRPNLSLSVSSDSPLLHLKFSSFPLESFLCNLNSLYDSAFVSMSAAMSFVHTTCNTLAVRNLLTTYPMTLYLNVLRSFVVVDWVFGQIYNAIFLFIRNVCWLLQCFLALVTAPVATSATSLFCISVFCLICVTFQIMNIILCTPHNHQYSAVYSSASISVLLNVLQSSTWSDLSVFL